MEETFFVSSLSLSLSFSISSMDLIELPLTQLNNPSHTLSFTVMLSHVLVSATHPVLACVSAEPFRLIRSSTMKWLT